ncbi:MAG TPA: penicillin-binding protein 2 [Candidatus Bathyarchaeia archaeon]|nr:penicillin-binding protein 2 [Candidatus Bathyarchaeia archaeon]
MDTSRRIRISLLSLWLFSFLVLGRLFYWQILKTDELASAAAKQHLDVLEIPAQRGQFFASDNFPFVTNQEVYLLYVSLSEIGKDFESVAQELAPILVDEQMNDLVKTATASGITAEEVQELIKIKEEEIKQQFLRQDVSWLPIQHKISREAKEKIEAMRIGGLGFEREQKRTYPEGTASAHLMGFVGSDVNGKPKGYFGLEGFYDLELQGHPGYLKREKDASGKPILLGISQREDKRDGRSLLTSLDRTLQFIVENRLKQALAKYGAISGSVLIIDPGNGAVLAMVSLPTYDPSIYSEFDEKIFLNPAVASSYEPGSTFKVLIMAAAVNEGVIGPETQCTSCGGPVEIAGYTINTWNNQYYPNSTATDILVHSDNLGMVFVGRQLGIKKLHAYLKKFGLGQLTGIDLQEEDTVSLRLEKEWREIDLATASFGQGIAVTPIQMLRAVSVIANGGKLVKPFIVKGVIDQGKTTMIEPEMGKTVLKGSTAKTLTEMMVAAVERGEAKWTKPTGFLVAGKTGTAQIPVAGHYDRDKTIASFIGFAPAQQPRFAMLVTLREPTSSPWGSETAAPLWFDIAKELFTYYGISPTK